MGHFDFLFTCYLLPRLFFEILEQVHLCQLNENKQQLDEQKVDMRGKLEISQSGQQYCSYCKQPFVSLDFEVLF